MIEGAALFVTGFLAGLILGVLLGWRTMKRISKAIIGRLAQRVASLERRLDDSQGEDGSGSSGGRVLRITKPLARSR